MSFGWIGNIFKAKSELVSNVVQQKADFFGKVIEAKANFVGGLVQAGANLIGGVVKAKTDFVSGLFNGLGNWCKSIFCPPKPCPPPPCPPKPPAPPCGDWKTENDCRSAVITLNASTELRLDQTDQSVVLVDHATNTATRLSGQGGFDQGADGTVDATIKQDTTFNLADGTKITVQRYEGFADRVSVTKGDRAILVENLAADAKGQSANLFLQQSHKDGRWLDDSVDDGLSLTNSGGQWQPATA
ncbi:MAG: DUF1521 domain-containing protein [Alsobacter sp.]